MYQTIYGNDFFIETNWNDSVEALIFPCCYCHVVIVIFVVVAIAHQTEAWMIAHKFNVPIFIWNCYCLCLCHLFVFFSFFNKKMLFAQNINFVCSLNSVTTPDQRKTIRPTQQPPNKSARKNQKKKKQTKTHRVCSCEHVDHHQLVVALIFVHQPSENSTYIWI